MPVYEFRCEGCGGLSELTCPVAERPAEIACRTCGGVAHRIVSHMAVRLSSASKVERLDPKYDRMVDRAMRSTQHAEPDRLLGKMKPFSESD
jgi:putative FmdB family regulatory protein